jgi:hypothetical protein
MCHVSYLQKNLVSFQGVQFETSLQNNTQQHNNQYDCFNGQLRNYKINLLKCSLYQQQNIFQRHCSENKDGLHANNKVAEQLAKEGKHFTDAEFVKL